MLRFASSVARYLILILFLGSGATGFAAQKVPWTLVPMSTTANDQPVSDFVKDFAASQDIPVSVSEEVSGTVNGSFNEMLPEEIFDSVMKAYALVPYFDGSILYIYAASEMKSAVIALEKLNTAEFQQLLQQLEVYDANFTFRTLPEQNLVYVSGPPRYVDLLEELATKFDTRSFELQATAEVTESKAASKIEVRYFELRYANADDLLVDFQDRQVTIPGVARLLGHVLGESAPELRDSTGTTSTRKPRTVERLKGQGLVEGEVPVRINQEAPVVQSELELREEMAEERDSAQEQPMNAFVQADSRLNAVIVADRAEKMPLYEKLIADLDKPAGVIEINAAIIDINANANLNWGVDYTARNNETFNTNGDGTPTTTGVFRAGQNAGTDLIDGAALVQGAGLNTSALIVGTTFQILARIRALEQAGEAQVLSRPSVITVDNTEAILRDDSTIYIRVAGQEEVDLFPVSAGVLLRVTPHLIPASGKGERDKIRLQIRIEDGNFSNESVDAIPVVRRSEITTQAIVAQDESLLIGGQYRHEQSNAEDRVPIAGRVPLIGNAFKNKQVINSKRQRLFLISPNVIDPDEYYRKAERITSETFSAPPLNPEAAIPKSAGEVAEPEFNIPPPPPFRAEPIESSEEKPSLLKRLFGPKQ
ncbi:MAG: type III secretion system outer membrane ring subunit SctC [Verrucomicrobiota bacterium]